MHRNNLNTKYTLYKQHYQVLTLLLWASVDVNVDKKKKVRKIMVQVCSIEMC